MDILLLFPGQGSQQPGMARDLTERFPAARRVFNTVDCALGFALSDLCFAGDRAELTATVNAQPALLAHGIAAWEVVRERLEPHVRAAAGHSLGEFTAHCAAGTITLAEAVRLVRRRGELMQACGAERPGTMAAVLGLADDAVECACERATEEAGVVVPANYNAPGQLVISGDVTGVERAMMLAKEAGAKRAVRLSVSGAFHSPLMRSAEAGLRAALDEVHWSEPRIPVYANVSACPSADAAAARALLCEQLTAPVRWTDLIRNMAAAYPGATFVELGPGAVLSGLVKRIVPDAPTAACGTAADVDALLQRAA
ncbi:MAG TPA: ACP S-malonyltransferase [Gemmatimonadaceae bacterium]|nr:ACP S-malonyltransferase [Gemmatimonadaceae bacterium]